MVCPFLVNHLKNSVRLHIDAIDPTCGGIGTAWFQEHRAIYAIFIRVTDNKGRPLIASGNRYVACVVREINIEHKTQIVDTSSIDQRHVRQSHVAIDDNVQLPVRVHNHTFNAGYAPGIARPIAALRRPA